MYRELRTNNAAPVFGLVVKPRPYKCMCCGHESKQSTNHTDVFFPHCTNCSWRSNFVEAGHPLNFTALDKGRPAEYIGGEVQPEEINRGTEK